MADDAVDDLYAGPLDGFVKRREALVAERKKGGDKAGAAAAKALAKPSVSAHGINLLWASRRDDFEALLAAGEALRRAVHHNAGDAIREAQKEQRAQVSRLRNLAGELLVHEGHAANAGTLERMARSLGAISTRGSFSPGEAGRLTTDLEPPGLDELLEVMPAIAAPAHPHPHPHAGKKASEHAAAASGAAPAHRHDDRDREAAADERAEHERRRRADEAHAARLGELRQAVKDADTEREAARKQVEKATSTMDAAQHEVAALEAQLERARKQLADARKHVEQQTRTLATRTETAKDARRLLDEHGSG